MKRFLILALLCAGAFGQEARRPRITGVAHVAFFAKDVEQARKFYTGLLGYDEVFSVKHADGALAAAVFKINERQYIEILPEREPASDRLDHIALETDDAEALRRYLASNGVKVPEAVGRNRVGDASFRVLDPDGHTVEFVQYLPSGWSRRDAGKAVSSRRISTTLMHAGIIVNSLEPAMKFYRDILGFEEFWRGSPDEKVLRWVNMKVPDGDSYLEFMLHDPVPEPTRRGSAHHICLAVPEMDATAAALKERTPGAGYTRPMEIRTGTNRKRQMNLFDPDGTRTEVMEPHTVDGKPSPRSSAPPPR